MGFSAGTPGAPSKQAGGTRACRSTGPCCRDPDRLDAGAAATSMQCCTSPDSTDGTGRAPRRQPVLARKLTASLDRPTRGPPSSTPIRSRQVTERRTATGKEAAADHPRTWRRDRGVAGLTFGYPTCSASMAGRTTTRSLPRSATNSPASVPRRSARIERYRLLHVQDAVDELISRERAGGGVCRRAVAQSRWRTCCRALPDSAPRTPTGDIPDVRDAFELALFNTYRSFCFPDRFTR